MPFSRCPCGNAAPPRRCCRPILDGSRAAPSARALLRARYVALRFLHRDFVEAVCGGWPLWADDADRWCGVEIDEATPSARDETAPIEIFAVTTTVQEIARGEDGSFDPTRGPRPPRAIRERVTVARRDDGAFAVSAIERLD
jgi:uncharacterized protein YchJ